MSLPQLQSLVLSEGKGLSLRLRIGIPPNIAQTAPRDAIMVRVEALVDGEPQALESLDRGRAYAPDAPTFLALLQIESWCNGKLVSMLQLSRDRMRQLLEPLRDEPVVYSIRTMDTPMKWVDGELPDVHPHLEEKEEPESEPKFNPTKKTITLPKREAERDLTPMHVDGSTNYIAIMLPSRDSVMYEDALELVKENGFKLEPRNRKWWLRDKHKTLTFLADYWHELEDTYRANFSQNFQDRTKQIKLADLECYVDDKAGEYDVEVILKAGDLDSDEAQRTLASGRLYAETRKSIVLFGKPERERLNDLRKKLDGSTATAPSATYRTRVQSAEIPILDETLEELGEVFEPPEGWSERGKAMRDLSKLEPAPMNDLLRDTLRPYQAVGAAWIWHLYRYGLGGILADEMGLGKTLQALALLSAVQAEDPGARFLIIVPASLLENWRRETERFAPQINVTVHHGQSRIKDADILRNRQMIVTSYGTLTRDLKVFRELMFNVIVADETQHVKNRRTQAAKSLRTLRGNCRIGLTGTPIENSLEDLRSIFAFLLPGYLDHAERASKMKDRSVDDQRARQRAAPYILRRTKDAVAKELPDKIEQTLYCELDGKQAKLYEKMRDKGRQQLFEMEMAKASEGSLRLAYFNQLLRLRQICAEPSLVDNSFEEADSAKMQTFLELLEESEDGGHRMLVFSSFVKVLQSIRDTLDKREIEYCYLDGSTRKRQQEVDRFNDSNIPVFLISLKAGGTGLNLTGADTVVHFDPWWNPAVEAQATDRAHRIGQTKVVTSYKLIAAGTVEERVLDLQLQKSKLLKELFEESEAASSKLELDTLKSFFEK